jgi:hypothetical protein
MTLCTDSRATKDSIAFSPFCSESGYRVGPGLDDEARGVAAWSEGPRFYGEALLGHHCVTRKGGSVRVHGADLEKFRSEHVVKMKHVHGIDGGEARFHKHLAFAWHGYVDVGADLRRCAGLRHGDCLHNDVLEKNLAIIFWPLRSDSWVCWQGRETVHIYCPQNILIA